MKVRRILEIFISYALGVSGQLRWCQCVTEEGSENIFFKQDPSIPKFIIKMAADKVILCCFNSCTIFWLFSPLLILSLSPNTPVLWPSMVSVGSPLLCFWQLALEQWLLWISALQYCLHFVHGEMESSDSQVAWGRSPRWEVERWYKRSQSLSPFASRPQPKSREMYNKDRMRPQVQRESLFFKAVTCFLGHHFCFLKLKSRETEGQGQGPHPNLQSINYS